MAKGNKNNNFINKKFFIYKFLCLIIQIVIATNNIKGKILAITE